MLFSGYPWWFINSLKIICKVKFLGMLFHSSKKRRSVKSESLKNHLFSRPDLGVFEERRGRLGLRGGRGRLFGGSRVIGGEVGADRKGGTWWEEAEREKLGFWECWKGGAVLEGEKQEKSEIGWSEGKRRLIARKGDETGFISGRGDMALQSLRTDQKRKFWNYISDSLALSESIIWCKSEIRSCILFLIGRSESLERERKGLCCILEGDEPWIIF